MSNRITKWWKCWENWDSEQPDAMQSVTRMSLEIHLNYIHINIEHVFGYSWVWGSVPRNCVLHLQYDFIIERSQLPAWLLSNFQTSSFRFLSAISRHFAPRRNLLNLSDSTRRVVYDKRRSAQALSLNRLSNSWRGVNRRVVSDKKRSAQVLSTKALSISRKIEQLMTYSLIHLDWISYDQMLSAE